VVGVCTQRGCLFLRFLWPLRMQKYKSRRGPHSQSQAAALANHLFLSLSCFGQVVRCGAAEIPWEMSVIGYVRKQLPALSAINCVTHFWVLSKVFCWTAVIKLGALNAHRLFLHTHGPLQIYGKKCFVWQLRCRFGPARALLIESPAENYASLCGQA